MNPEKQKPPGAGPTLTGAKTKTEVLNMSTNLTKNEPDVNILNAALEYQQHGFSVVPILPGEKNPPILWKEFQTRIASIEEIHQWWQQWPKANVAIICGEISGIDCIDLDGPFALDNLEGQSGVTLPETVSQTTGRPDGGKHIIFKHHGGGLKNWVGFAENGNDSKCDLRTNGGLFVAAPSIHKSGERYEWIVSPLIEDPEPFPPGVQKFISDWATKKSGVAGERERVDPEKWLKDGIPDGQKYHDSFRYACKCISRNMAFDETVACLETLFGNCDPLPKEGPRAAAVKIAKEAYKKHGDERNEKLKAEFDKMVPISTITAKDLLNLRIPPIKWAVDGVIAEGLTILAGKPKMGKSILALNLCVSVAMGTKAFGYAECKTGGVLYLALEDVKRRLQSRLNTMLMPEQLNGDGMPENLHFATEWPRMGAGGIKQLREKIKSIPDIKMVVIDTLKMFRPMDADNKKVYDADYDPISALKKVADEFNVAVVIIHHLRKSASEDVMDTMSGSFGLTGASDTNIVVERSTAATSDAILHVVGRDVEAAQLGMTFEPHTLSWNILGPMSQLVGGSIQQQEVFDAIKDGFSSPSTIRKKTDLNRDNINKVIKKLLDSGKIEKVGHGEYKVINLEEPIVRTTNDEVPF
jgi:hypothetical protein